MKILNISFISEVKPRHRLEEAFFSPVLFFPFLSSLGSFGGGQTMTVTGTGFNPQNSEILVCGSECAVDRLKSDYTTLLCKIPPNNGKLSEKKNGSLLETVNFIKIRDCISFFQVFVSLGQLNHLKTVLILSNFFRIFLTFMFQDS